MRFAAELRPNNGSVVARIDKHQWADSAWMHERTRKIWLDAPISIYEVHLGSWRRYPRR